MHVAQLGPRLAPETVRQHDAHEGSPMPPRTVPTIKHAVSAGFICFGVVLIVSAAQAKDFSDDRDAILIRLQTIEQLVQDSTATSIPAWLVGHHHAAHSPDADAIIDIAVREIGGIIKDGIERQVVLSKRLQQRLQTAPLQSGAPALRGLKGRVRPDGNIAVSLEDSDVLGDALQSLLPGAIERLFPFGSRMKATAHEAAARASVDRNLRRLEGHHLRTYAVRLGQTRAPFPVSVEIDQYRGHKHEGNHGQVSYDDARTIVTTNTNRQPGKRLPYRLQHVFSTPKTGESLAGARLCLEALALGPLMGNALLQYVPAGLKPAGNDRPGEPTAAKITVTVTHGDSVRSFPIFTGPPAENKAAPRSPPRGPRREPHAPGHRRSHVRVP